MSENTDAKGKKGKTGKIIFAVVAVMLVAGALAAWYIFNEKFTAMAEREAAYVVEVNDFIKEFEANDSSANAKYREKIVSIRGVVSDIETIDSTMNLKMVADSGNSYVIFAFEPAAHQALKGVTPGSEIVVKGSCSGGTYSEILETHYISFKRSILDKESLKN